MLVYTISLSCRRPLEDRKLVRALLTGGLGFLGLRLGRELDSRGHEVAVLDRVHGDLADEGVAVEYIGTNRPDLVMHLAARPGRVICEQDPTRTIADNVTTSTLVAKACGELGVRLCYISTSEVYGDYKSSHPLTETDAGLGRLLNLYSVTKWAGELVSQLYAPDDLLIVRPSMAYGPGMRTGHGRAALPTMIDSFLRSEPYTVHAGAMRSWCYVDDLVRGMADVIEHGEGVYNVGRDDDLRGMLELAYLVCDVLGTDKSLIEVGQADNTITLVKDISMDRLRSLGWSPLVGIEDGIKLTADSFR